MSASDAPSETVYQTSFAQTCLETKLLGKDTNNRDRVWLNLKSWHPSKLQPVEKKDGYRFLCKEVKRMIQQWTWRQTVLPCSPKDMMTHLLKFLKKHSGWIPSCEKNSFRHLKNNKTNAFFNSRKEWNCSSQWQGILHGQKRQKAFGALEPRWKNVSWYHDGQIISRAAVSRGPSL